ncbi:replication restart DNA helicase PriA [Hypnocyclicus thermotrophus]|uniref:Replication restart protein PriA n=1 Tax=Hypnocyclicus thermotrophus TaxID=1627895 RepID=A0AA46I5K9_9FUSO|nr:primosomal protein N' [Hypnocyclicus thermotrophus]TDT68616.1 replication restart DNA helicase PriA [Hypnocyclicus thermotrophus]
MRYLNLYVYGQEGFYVYLDENNEYEIGEHVLVMFMNRKKIGLVVSESKDREFSFKVNKILQKLYGEIKFSKNLIELFLWIQNHYLCSFSQLIDSIYPKDLKAEIEKYYKLSNEFIPADEKDKEFLNYIKKKEKYKLKTLYNRYTKGYIEKLIKKKVLEEVNQEFNTKNNYNDFKDIKVILENNKINLNEEQKLAKEKIINGNKKYYLLYGVTGSGKTEVYIQLIRDAIIENKGAIFLLPEISLTPQMIKRFKEEFGEQIAILHSKLTNTDRKKEWLSIYNGNKKIVLGVRSAIFAPVKNLKYIIMDEEHETTYKQDTNPRYNAKYVAIKRAEIDNCKVIFGSATPSIESYYFAQNNIFELIKLKNRFNSIKMPKINIVDMKREENEYFSKKLIKRTIEELRKNNQVIFFINRKGYSTYIQCKECGHVEECPNCAVSLDFYASSKEYKCNYCGYKRKYTNKCSSCGSTNLKYSGKGTEKIETELKKHFKDSKIIRVDADTTKDRDSYAQIYNDFYNKKYDIMIGTQIISKGFHFPNVTLVGIITADTIINFPDFRAGEKTFQIISQTAGRAGRDKKEGEVLIQTYNPDHYSILSVINHNYEEFYDIEIKNRKMLNYPPFSRIINIIVSGLEIEKVFKKAKKLYGILINIAKNLEIYGPIEAPIFKIKSRYRYQIFIKGERKEINRIKKYIIENVNKEKNDSVRIVIDVDPMNLM